MRRRPPAAACSAASLPSSAAWAAARSLSRSLLTSSKSISGLSTAACYCCFPSDGLPHLPFFQPAPPATAGGPINAAAPKSPPTALQRPASMPLMLHGGGAWPPGPLPACFKRRLTACGRSCCARRRQSPWRARWPFCCVRVSGLGGLCPDANQANRPVFLSPKRALQAWEAGNVGPQCQDATLATRGIMLDAGRWPAPHLTLQPW